MGQFLGESLVTTLAALVVAFFLTVLLLPVFNTLANKHFTLGHLLESKLLLALLGTTLLVALLSGSYPALYLSRLQPLLALQSNRFTGRHSDWLRKGLVVLQYSVTLLLVVATGVMLQQMAFIRNSALSQGGDQMLSIRYSGVASLDKYRLFKQRLEQDPELRTVTMANHLPYYEFTASPLQDVAFPELGNQSLQWSTINGDFDFPAAFNLKLLAGRSFQGGNLADSNAYLLNESAVKALGVPLEKVLGLTLQIKRPWEEAKDYKQGQVIGIVRDFPYKSVHQRITPLLINGRPDLQDQIVYVKLPKDKVAEKIADMEKVWKQVLPGEGFDYWFLSQEYGRVYEMENRMAALFKSFSLLSILIACLGLFGLASYQAERRQREIGIRKVLGASLYQIIRLLLSGFLALLAMASLITLPLAWLLMHRWLEGFTYRVDIDVLIFLVGIALVLLLTAASVGYETMRAALANPVDTLKQE
jgi:putative ABC transport system permease protein